jgi:hypothetical protein
MDINVTGTISEDLGGGLVAELDQESGTLTILDAERGIELPAMQALNLAGFLSQHDSTFLQRALERVHLEDAA